MHADEQVILLLKFALTIGPVAVYFLALGYLNAQPRPAVLSGRADFLLLTIVLFPVLLWAILLAGLSPLTIGLGGIVAAVCLWLALPARNSSWVAYNITARQFLRALQRALGRLGISADRVTVLPGGDEVWTVEHLALRIRVSPFAMLQNVTCRFEHTAGKPVAAGQLSNLRRALNDSLGATHALPSASAAAFLLIGTVMLSAPLFLMARNVDAIVKVVRSLFA